MNELIKLKTSEGGKKTVSARELHEFLGVKEQFTDWIQRKINDYDFVKDIDFRSFTEKSEKGGRPRTEYEITIEMAKELSMLENNEQGKKARKYFIKCEKELNSNVIPINASKELKAIFMLDEKQQVLEEKVNDLESNMPLFNIECKELQSTVKSIGTKALGGYKSPAYKDNSLRGKVYSDIQHQLKREFDVNRYEAIKHSQFVQAKDIVVNYKLPTALKEKVDLTNNQISMEG
jgi:phage anti-repressor protein